MSDNLFGVVEGTSLHATAMAEKLQHFQFRFEAVQKPPGRDINEILIFFAPNTLYDIRTPVIRTHINMLKQNVLGNIHFNIEGHLEFEKKHMCYGSPGNASRNYDRVVDILLKVAQDQERRVAHKLPLVVVRSQTAFIAFTENLATLVAHLRQTSKPTTTTTTVPAKVYAEFFRSFAEMHQLRLKEGTMFGGRAVINKQELVGAPDFVCTRNNQPVIIIKVYSNNANNNHRNNNNDRCQNRNTPVKREAFADLKLETQCPTRESHPCDNCGQLATVCSELSYLTAKTSNFSSDSMDADLRHSLKDEVATDMLVALCRDDVLPYFSNPPRILAIIVKETRVRFARLKLDEDDVICFRAGGVTSEKPVIYYSRSYNMLNIADRQLLSPALFRLADTLG